MNALNDMSQLAGGSGAAKLFSAAPLLAEVKVDFDRSVLLQMALFAILIFILKPLLFDPMLKLFALREEKTEGEKARAREMQERAGDILSRYESEVGKARADAQSERENLRKETLALEAEILEKARASADEITAEGQKKIQAELQVIEKSLQAESKELAGLVSQAVLKGGA